MKESCESSSIIYYIHVFVSQLKEDIQVKSNEAQREIRKKEKLERELKQVKSEVETKHSELKAKQNQAQKAQEENSRLEHQLKEQRVSYL